MNESQSLKQRVYDILEGPTTESTLSRWVQTGIFSLIVLNIAALVLETVESIYQAAPAAFLAFETVSLYIFSLEYGLRVWSCTASPHYRAPFWGRLRYIRTPLALIDLLAILPFFLSFTFDLRSLRMVRLLRLAKLGRYSVALQTIGHVLLAKQEELVTLMGLLFLLLLGASSCMYFAEHHAQPDQFSSIPATMWWGIATLTTVGYGDIYPVTELGKAIASVIAILGIGIFALPAGILGAAFLEEFQSHKSEPKLCPHCGEVITKDE